MTKKAKFTKYIYFKKDIYYVQLYKTENILSKVIVYKHVKYLQLIAKDIIL